MFLFLFLACASGDMSRLDLGSSGHHDIHCHQADGIHDYSVIDAWSRDDQWVLRLSAQSRKKEGTNPWIALDSIRGLCHKSCDLSSQVSM